MDMLFGAGGLKHEEQIIVRNEKYRYLDFCKDISYICRNFTIIKAIYMLIQFSIGNYRTFKEKATLSLVASNYDKTTREDDNVYAEDKFGLRILKSAVIYGANASGKSKLLEAVEFMRWLVLNSFRKIQIGEKIKVHPFLFHSDFENAPSYFEIIFYHNKILYRYGFEVTKEEVESEWLFMREIRKEILIFKRQGEKREFHPVHFKVGKSLQRQEMLRKNALILSSAAQTNNKIVEDVIDWFKNLQILSGLREEGYEGYTINRFSQPGNKESIVEFLKAAAMGIADIAFKKTGINDIPADFPIELNDNLIKKINGEGAELFTDVLTKHKKYDKNLTHTGLVDLSMGNDESSGTRKFFALAGPIFDTLQNGYTLIVDELDSKLHPNLVCKISEMFNSKEINQKNAQIIFNTHNSNLLSSGLFRRDQVWFTKKDRYGEAKLYSLSDIKVRRDNLFENDYLDGRYGAIPYLGYFDNLLKRQKNFFLRQQNKMISGKKKTKN
ncbi:MAG: ATP-binding protein [Ignavibacteriae bacterium]|nr:ATP-binding protein [Ignavibacteriota bacterium]